MVSSVTKLPRCEWCNGRVKVKPLGRPARFCSASCRQRAYERRQLTKRKQAEADTINAAKYPAWATHLHVKPKLPPRLRPRRLQCPVCKFPFDVKARGPIPATCSRRCALALALHTVYMQGVNKPRDLMNEDIVANSFLSERKRHQKAIIDNILGGVDKPTNRRR
jgi:hypothetical protein